MGTWAAFLRTPLLPAHTRAQAGGGVLERRAEASPTSPGGGRGRLSVRVRGALQRFGRWAPVPEVRSFKPNFCFRSLVLWPFYFH